MVYENILQEIKLCENKELAAHHMRFFKTGKGEYGEGDIFCGLSVPQIKEIAKKYFLKTTFSQLEKLLQNPYHEVRFCALFMLVLRFEKMQGEQKEIFRLYLKNTKYINNWDLVDVSCYKIVGRYVFENRDYSALDTLADSKDLWCERIAVVSTMYLVKRGDFSKTKEFAIKFLEHKHDLIHKAVGWLLREMGKVDEKELCAFLDNYAPYLPRTALRYSIEKLPSDVRKHYMKLKAAACMPVFTAP